MPISLKHRSPTGEVRPWTLKEIVQGKPLGHPSHPMFVHFPIAFYLAAIGLDVMSRIYLLLGGAVAAVILLVTGLVDWFEMVRGSSKRRLATKHMLVQLSSVAFFQASLFLRFPERHQARADIVWIVLEVIGYLIMIVGQYLGGVLVYEKGMRVSTGMSRSERMDATPGAP
jgi:uncharacterized membrane protein